MRFKPPPLNSPIGWRIEFRPLEVQLTDFENAAFTVFVVLLTRAILSFKLNFLIPISKMQENMVRAQARDAIHRERFYFRKSVVPDDDEDEGAEPSGSRDQGVEPRRSHDQEYTEMSIDAILNGKDEFPGLIPLVRMYVNSIDMDVDTRCTVMQYLRLISKRASGELMTTATWIRHFLTSHPLYKQDSVVTEEMTFDLIQRMREISEGTSPCPELTGKLLSKTPETYRVVQTNPRPSK
jgi:glutamate--cysteine ligase catalytic subunit